jgi:hypothetical protein
MSHIKRAIEEYIELSCGSEDLWDAIGVPDSQECAAFYQWVSIREVCHRIASMQYGLAKLRRATRLWNYIDRIADPEPCWKTMVELLPDCFCDGCVNNMKFTYAR